MGYQIVIQNEVMFSFLGVFFLGKPNDERLSFKKKKKNLYALFLFLCYQYKHIYLLELNLYLVSFFFWEKNSAIYQI